MRFCRHHRNRDDCVLYPERCDLHDNELENIMGDLTKVTADLDTFLTATATASAAKDARITELEAQVAQLQADQATQNDNDQAAIDALDQKIVSATPVAAAPVTATARTLYTYTGSDLASIDATMWVQAGASDDGKQLYTFAGDLNAGDATGASADWAVFTPAS